MSFITHIARKLRSAWIRGWLLFAGPGHAGRIACWFASWLLTRHLSREQFISEAGYIAPTARLRGRRKIRLGSRVLLDDQVNIESNGAGAVEIGDRVSVFRGVSIEKGDGGSVKIGSLSKIHSGCHLKVQDDGGAIELGDRVTLLAGLSIWTGAGGAVTIGSGSNLHPECKLFAVTEHIVIGENASIAARCAFYSYNHGTELGVLVEEQPLTSDGPVVIGDGVWLGHGVVVLSGARIGNGAVVGAGSVVMGEIPDNAIAMGNPARVIGYRQRRATEHASLGASMQLQQ